MKRNGFTLVELLVVIVILGIITGISIPILRGVQQKNAMRKYEVFMDTVVKSGKLYVDAYEQDLFGYGQSGCRIITFADMDERRLIKDIPDEGISCNSEDTYVKVKKDAGGYHYYPSIGCGSVGADGKVIVDTKLSKDTLTADDFCY